MCIWPASDYSFVIQCTDFFQDSSSVIIWSIGDSVLPLYKNGNKHQRNVFACWLASKSNESYCAIYWIFVCRVRSPWHMVLYHVLELVRCVAEAMKVAQRRFLPRDAMLSAVYAVVVCPSVCLSVCVCVCHIPVLYQNG